MYNYAIRHFVNELLSSQITGRICNYTGKYYWNMVKLTGPSFLPETLVTVVNGVFIVGFPILLSISNIAFPISLHYENDSCLSKLHTHIDFYQDVLVLSNEFMSSIVALLSTKRYSVRINKNVESLWQNFTTILGCLVLNHRCLCTNLETIHNPGKIVVILQQSCLQ